jgi:hypothetical protein
MWPPAHASAQPFLNTIRLAKSIAGHTYQGPFGRESRTSPLLPDIGNIWTKSSIAFGIARAGYPVLCFRKEV